MARASQRRQATPAGRPSGDANRAETGAAERREGHLSLTPPLTGGRSDARPVSWVPVSRM
jgi:hypothetical protein